SPLLDICLIQPVHLAVQSLEIGRQIESRAEHESARSEVRSQNLQYCVLITRYRVQRTTSRYAGSSLHEPIGRYAAFACAAPRSRSTNITTAAPAMMNTKRLKIATLALCVKTSICANKIGPTMLVARHDRLKKPKNSAVFAVGVIAPIIARLIDCVPPITSESTTPRHQNCHRCVTK